MTAFALDCAKMGGMDVKAWREEHGLSQAQLARLLEVDQMTISRWERGVRPRAASGRILELALTALDQELRERQRRQS
jgi:transcriptional regulator with XRE-family HTH domain